MTTNCAILHGKSFFFLSSIFVLTAASAFYQYEALIARSGAVARCRLQALDPKGISSLREPGGEKNSRSRRDPGTSDD